MKLVDADTPGAIAVTRTWLEIHSVDDIGPARPVAEEPTLLVAGDDGVAWWWSRFFYTHVGADWGWVDRLSWNEDRWRQWATQPGYELCWVTLDGLPAGYAEIVPEAGGSTEIAYFGLMPHAIGRGLGGWLLETMLRRAFAVPGTMRVHLNTGTIDGPNAMANYLARGLRPYREEVEWRLPA